ncbi:MAG: 30S ribosomal protein S20 [Firmicutes bacterium]|nr:30S ribosomal protein S20 [Bacillota bacterium]MDD4692923.1 30S ribosomal protein S20 [Bacillota bacterium]
MANIKSAQKRILTTQRNSERNRTVLSSMRTSIKKFLSAVEDGNKEVAQSSLVKAFSTIDKAAKKGVIHKNQADRRKARLHQKLAAM